MVWITRRNGRYLLRWEAGEKRHQRTLPKGTKERDARRAVVKKEDELKATYACSNGPETWGGFLAEYKERFLESTSRSNRTCWRGVVSYLEQAAREAGHDLKHLDDITPNLLHRMRALISEDCADSTVETYTATLLSGLRKAQKLGWMHQVPAVVRDGRKIRDTDPNIRHMTGEEFDRWCENIRKKFGKRADGHIAASGAMFWGGIRLFEVLDFHWTDERYHVPLLDQEYPAVLFSTKQKNRMRQLVPIAPEFAELLRNLPHRDGWVFELQHARNGRYQDAEKLSRRYSEVAEKASIYVGSKRATAKHLRKAFCSRWAQRVMPARLMQLARHASIQTTMQYYVGRNVNADAADLWEHAADVTPQVTPKSKTRRPNAQS